MYAARIATACLILPAALAAQTQDTRNTITVTATATVEREPDRARLSFAVVSEGATAESASQANANLMTQVIAALRDMGLTGTAVRTTSIQISPRYSRGQGEEPRIVGYTATNMVEATIDSLPRVGAITDGAIAAGANRVTGLMFELRQPDAARREALAMAMAKARAEAETVAAAAGRTLGPTLWIEVEPEQGVPMFRSMAGRAEMAQAMDTPVEAGTLNVSATVRVVYWMDVR